MNRREAAALLGGAVVGWPLGARAQQPAMPVVGLLFANGSKTGTENLTALLRGLGEAGYVEGQNVSIEYKWAEGELVRLPALASELIRDRVAVIVATPLPAALAAKAATATIPIVFTSGDDPVKAGLVASINRPGGNATGVSQFTTMLAGKRLDLLHEILPKAKSASLLLDPKNPTSETELADIKEAGRASGMDLRILNASTDREIESAFATLGEQQSDVLLVGAGPFLNSRRFKLAEFAAHLRLPAIYPYRIFVTAGGLISYGSVITENYHLAGIYAGRILKGEKPADLPVLQPTKFELVINLKAAKALGLEIPPTLLATANEVIE